MKPFKIFLLSTIVTLGVFTLTIYSCQKDTCAGVLCNTGNCVDGACKCPDGYVGTNCERVKCGNVICDIGKICVNGACACPTGYEGVNCGIVSRDKFVGVWTVLEKGTLSNTAQYSISLQANNNNLTLKIKNFKNFFVNDVIATVKGDSIFIASQVLNNQTIVGKGIFSNPNGQHGKITMWYKVTDPANDVDDFGYDAGTPSAWEK